MQFGRWKERARSLKREVHARYLGARDRRTPWYAKALGAFVVGYALSPLDLIPDPIPVLGYLDDLVLIPLGVLLVRALILLDVLADCRAQAAAQAGTPKPRNWIAGGVIIAAWFVTVALIGWWVCR
jgi:uncharacterized membrane protein YkvA (DUF1232 family)